MIRWGGRHDRIRTTPAVPVIVLRVLLVAFVAVVAAALVPVIGWQLAVVVMAVLGAVIPHSFGGWVAIAGIAVGMLMSEPGIGQAALAVFAVHVIHALSSLLLMARWNSRVVLAALWPTLRRLLLIQLIAQPVTLLIILAFTGGVRTIEGATIIGAAALVILVTALFRLLRTWENAS